MGEGGWGGRWYRQILITLELFYSTKRIQRVAVSPHRTTKVINRAINKKRTNRRKKIQEMTKTKSKTKQNKTKNEIKQKQIYIINTETLNVEP